MAVVGGYYSENPQKVLDYVYACPLRTGPCSVARATHPYLAPSTTWQWALLTPVAVHSFPAPSVRRI